VKRVGLLPVLIAGGLIAGCENRYEAITAPPPGLTASLDEQTGAIRVSRGVSIAFSCTTDNGNPCARTSSTESAGTALIFPANLDTLAETTYVRGPQPQAAFVVVGIAEGKTSVQAGGESLSVTVLP
jgi:hypothetical protein